MLREHSEKYQRYSHVTKFLLSTSITCITLPARQRGRWNLWLGCPPQGNRLDYHTKGTRRCRTRFWYSVYPGRFLARKRSSSKSRHSRKGIIAAIGTSPQYEPSASGVPSRYRDALAYSGWRTMA